MMKGKEEKREFWPLVLLPLWDIFWSTSSSPCYTQYIPFRSLGSQESNASNGVQIGVETKKLWSLQENWTELSGNFAHLNPRCENLSSRCINFAHLNPRCEKIFASCETTSWHTSAILHTSSQFLHRAKQGAKISHSAKLDSRCEILILRCENFASVGHIFEALPGAQIMHTIYQFKAQEVRNPDLQTLHDLDLKRRSYDCLKTDCAKVRKFF